mmetsp:Transcript_66639/g.124394  ORF Transcript_66639/g.124394 Transcript_66639/m.124394 type:complete len:251 (+) Transcript_66639:72-824(+)
MPGHSSFKFASDLDFYEILEVSSDASEEELRRAYRRLALKWHPDKHVGCRKQDAAERFKLLSEAYHVLSQRDLRLQHDAARGIGHQSTGMPFNNNMGAKVVWMKTYGWSTFNVSFGCVDEPYGKRPPEADPSWTTAASTSCASSAWSPLDMFRSAFEASASTGKMESSRGPRSSSLGVEQRPPEWGEQQAAGSPQFSRLPEVRAGNWSACKSAKDEPAKRRPKESAWEEYTCGALSHRELRELLIHNIQV